MDTSQQPPINMSSATPAPINTAPKKSHTLIIIISIVIILVSALIAVIAWYLNSGLNIVTYNEDPGLNQKQEFVLSGETINLPYSLGNPKVNRISLAYTFEGVFQKLVKQPSGVQIFIEDGEDLPSFISEGNRLRYYFYDSSRVPAAYASEKDLKPGDKIRINASYHLQQNRWFTYQVLIYRESIPRDAIVTDSEN